MIGSKPAPKAEKAKTGGEHDKQAGEQDKQASKSGQSSAPNESAKFPMKGHVLASAELIGTKRVTGSAMTGEVTNGPEDIGLRPLNFTS